MMLKIAISLQVALLLVGVLCIPCVGVVDGLMVDLMVKLQ
jgi:hypothetical protein